MTFLMKHMLGDKLKNMKGGGGGEEGDSTAIADGKETTASNGTCREELEE